MSVNNAPAANLNIVTMSFNVIRENKNPDKCSELTVYFFENVQDTLKSDVRESGPLVINLVW